jgi:hypothetical protein
MAIKVARYLIKANFVLTYLDFSAREKNNDILSSNIFPDVIALMR